MKTLTRLAVVAALAAAASQAGAKPIASIEDINVKSMFKVNFNEVKNKDNAAFGSFDVGQPYARIGLVLPSQTIDARANLSKDSTVAIRATRLQESDHSSYQSMGFTHPQKYVAFSVKSEKATSVIVTALDKDGNELERQILPPSADARFVGFARPDSDITVVRVVAPHATQGDAMESPTLVSDVIFATEQKEKSKDDVPVADVATAGAVAEASGGGGGSAVASTDGYSAYQAAFTDLDLGNQVPQTRNPGNRNPNLPPTVIPEPAGAVAFVPAALLLLRRRRA